MTHSYAWWAGYLAEALRIALQRDDSPIPAEALERFERETAVPVTS